MSDAGKFETQKATTMDCAAFEALLVDAVENALPAADALSFQEHAGRCERCSQLLLRARQGHDWLALLRQQEIEPPVDLVQTILARTSGVQPMGGMQPRGTSPMSAPSVTALPHAPGYPNPGYLAVGYPAATILAPRPWNGTPWTGTWKRPALVTLRRTVLEPRIALTAAMAFFSISLTLNMVGIRLGDLRPADLRPANLRRTLTRQYVLANSSVVRYYENLRFVYEVESRVQELRHAAETPDSSGEPQQKKSSSHSSSNGASGNGSSNDDSEPHRAPLARTPTAPAEHAPTPTHNMQRERIIQVPLGVPVDAALHLPQRTSSAFPVGSSYDAREKIFFAIMISTSLRIPRPVPGCVPERSAV